MCVRLSHMSEGLVKVKPPPVECVCVQGVGGSISINLTLIGDHVVSTVAEPQDNMAVCMCTCGGEVSMCVVFLLRLHQSHAHPSSSCLSLSMICAREMWLVLRLEAS